MEVIKNTLNQLADAVSTHVRKYAQAYLDAHPPVEKKTIFDRIKDGAKFLTKEKVTLFEVPKQPGSAKYLLDLCAKYETSKEQDPDKAALFFFRYLLNAISTLPASELRNNLENITLSTGEEISLLAITHDVIKKHLVNKVLPTDESLTTRNGQRKWKEILMTDDLLDTIKQFLLLNKSEQNEFWYTYLLSKINSVNYPNLEKQLSLLVMAYTQTALPEDCEDQELLTPLRIKNRRMSA